jgi:hypothetical protein
MQILYKYNNAKLYNCKKGSQVNENHATKWQEKYIARTSEPTAKLAYPLPGARAKRNISIQRKK